MGNIVIACVITFAATAGICLVFFGYMLQKDEEKHKAEMVCFAATFEQNRLQAAATQDAMTGAEMKALREQNNETEKIALFLRQHYKTEIELGYHSNRPLSDIVNGYLGLERRFSSVEHKLKAGGGISRRETREEHTT